MSELVKDPVYKKFITTQPKLPRVCVDQEKMQSPPWVVYVQREVYGKWGKKEFWSYTEAFKFMRRCLKAGVHDCAINCKRVGFEPPSSFVKIKGKFVVGSDGQRRQATKMVYWKPALLPEDPDHEWCMYCRRPTLFGYYRKHKRLTSIDPTVRRCCICGASERIALPPRPNRRRR